MAIQSIFHIQSIFQSSSEQPDLPTLWNQLSPEQQKQIAQRLAELIQRMRIPPAPAAGKSHENQ